MTTPGSGDATDIPPYDKTDLALAVGVITQELEEPATLIVSLSDEELLAIEGIQHRQLVPLPWAEKNLRTDEERAIATATATRSLIARGLVTMDSVKDPRLADEPGPGNKIAPALRGTVVARRTSDWVVIAERTTSQGRASGMFYIFDIEGSRRVLFEVFDEQGMHLFYLLDFKDFAEQFWLWIDPAREIGAEDGEPEEFTAAAFATSERSELLAQSRAATAVVVRGREESGPVQFSLFARPGAVELLEADGDGENAVQRIAPISRESLDALLLSLLEPAGDAAADAGQ